MKIWSLLVLLLLLARSGFGAAINQISTVQLFTNTLNAFNALSIDGVKRTIWLGPGTFALPVGTYRMHVSNNICIRGAGMNQTTITGIGLNDNPMIWLFDNCEISDLKLVSIGTGPNPQLGVVSDAAGEASSTNVLVQRVCLSGDDDNLWLQTDGGAYSTVLEAYNAIDWTIHDSIFQNRFDSVYISTATTPNTDIDGDGWDDTGRTRVRIFNSRLISSGPSLGTAAIGSASNLRVLGATARAELYGCYLESSGGTNLTTAAFLGGGPSSADATFQFPGGLYLNNCQVQIYGTNLSVGGVGACLVQSTNGWTFLNGVQSNSNNIVGTGTNYWLQGRSLASGVTSVGTAADTLEKDLLSFTALGGTLGATGQAMELLAWGSYAATANTKALRVKIGGVSMMDTAGRAINGGDWFLRSTVTRVSPTALRASALFTAPGFTTNDYTALTLTATTNIVWRVTGSNHTAAANDLVLEGYKINHLP